MILRLSAYNKLLNFVPATNSVASTGLTALRQPISNALCCFLNMERFDEK